MPVLTWLRRRPFTTTGAAVIAALAVLTGTAWRPLLALPWGHDVAYGLTSMDAGRLWTLGTSSWFAIAPWTYVPVLVSFVAVVGFAERRLGTLRTAMCWAAGQLGSVLAALWLIAHVGPGDLRGALDVGPSGGVMALAAGLTALAPSGRRMLLRGGLLAYVVGAALTLGHLADLVHLIAVLGGLLAGRLLSPRAGLPADDTRAVRLLRRLGGGTLSWLTTWKGLHYAYDPLGEGYVAYRRHLGVALALGDPVGSAEWQRRAPGVFTRHCAERRLVPAYFAVGRETASRVGGRSLQVAEDALVDLPGLEFRGKRWQDVRTARNRAAREGIACRLLPLADAAPDVVAQVRAISAGWLRRQRTPELGFTLGTVEHALDRGVRTAIAVDEDGTVHGFVSWLPVHGPDGLVHGWTLDLMRRRDDGFRPVIEFLIAESCLRFRDEGAELVSLSGAPLARSCGAAEGVLQRGLERSARLLEPLYGFASLHAFKAKFSPRAEPLHLCYRHLADLPWVLAAVVLAYLHTPGTAEVTQLPSRIAEPARRRPVMLAG